MQIIMHDNEKNYHWEIYIPGVVGCGQSYSEEFVWFLNACKAWKPERLSSNILNVLFKKPEKTVPNTKAMKEQIGTK